MAYEAALLEAAAQQPPHESKPALRVRAYSAASCRRLEGGGAGCIFQRLGGPFQLEGEGGVPVSYSGL